jgi:hypothetical protein
MICINDLHNGVVNDLHVYPHNAAAPLQWLCTCIYMLRYIQDNECKDVTVDVRYCISTTAIPIIIEGHETAFNCF